MAKITKMVEVTTLVGVTFDDSLLPDDEWRSMFYDIKTPNDLAKHLAYNYARNNARLSQLDGFADRDDKEVEFQEIETETEMA